MPADSAPHRLAHAVAADTLTATAEQQLFQAFPKLSSEMQRIIHRRFGAKPVADLEPATTFTTPLSEDEILAIFKKLYELSQLPGLDFDKETELYLEQQLADLLGFEVTTSHKGFKLPHIKGTIDSLPHLYSSPTQLNLSSMPVREAGIANRRSIFGWHLPNQSSDTVASQSQYWLSLPLRDFVTSEHSFSEVKQWAFKKKFLVINPYDACYCVAELLDDYTDFSGKYQLGGSPALVRQGMFWSPSNLGKVIMFMINDPGNLVKLGAYQILN